MFSQRNSLIVCREMNTNLAYCVFFTQISIALVIPLDWLKNTKVLKDNLKKFYHKTFVTTNASVSVDPKPFGPLDYPGNDTKKLDLVDKIWREYYDCLATKANSLNVHKVVPPYAVAAFAETSIQLDCAVCVSPEEMTEKADWYVTAEPLSGNAIMVEEDEHRQIVPYSFSLQFYYLQPFHEGFYKCRLKNDYDAPHFLHVLVPDVEPMLEVKPKTAKTGPYALDPAQIANTRLVLWSEWSAWSKCAYCDQVGKKFKIGYCKISLIENLPKSVHDAVQHSSAESTIPANVIIETEQLLAIFVYGVPCRSSLLPKAVLNDTAVKEYPTQILNSLCKEPCPKDVIVEVIDRDGNVKETYNNTAGEYYSHQPLPANSVKPELVTLYGDLGKPLLIPCPSLQFVNSPVEWSIGGTILTKSSIESVSNKRITINDLSEIIIKRVEEVDVKMYSCWSNRKQVGVVRLLLNEQPSFLQEYLLTVEMYPLFMVTILTFTLLYVALRMCLNRRKARIGALVSTNQKPKLMKMIRDSYRNQLAEVPQSEPAAASESE